MKLQLTPQPPCLRACSACAGDYEDPERTTAGKASEEDGEEARDETSADEKRRSVPRDKFPAPEE